MRERAVEDRVGVPPAIAAVQQDEQHARTTALRHRDHALACPRREPGLHADRTGVAPDERVAIAQGDGVRTVGIGDLRRRMPHALRDRRLRHRDFGEPREIVGGRHVARRIVSAGVHEMRADQAERRRATIHPRDELRLAAVVPLREGAARVVRGRDERRGEEIGHAPAVARAQAEPRTRRRGGPRIDGHDGIEPVGLDDEQRRHELREARGRQRRRRRVRPDGRAIDPDLVRRRDARERIGHGGRRRKRNGRAERGREEAKRDFGYAKEYVEWIWRIMQHDTPDDFVIATGETHSVEEFVQLAFAHVGIENWKDYVDFDENLKRPAEVDLLIGNPQKSKDVLGFEAKVKFAELVKIMVNHEMSLYAARR